MFSKKYQKILQVNLLLLIFILLAINASAQQYQKIYQISLELEGDSLSLRHVTLANGYPDDLRIQPKQGYFLALKSFKNETLYSRYFDFPQIAAAPPKEWFDEKGKQIFFPNKTEPLISKFILLSIPYFKEGKEIGIYKLNRRVLTIDVSTFSDICNNNGKCDGYKNFKACPAECDSSGKDNYCNAVYNKKCDPDCTKGEDIDCKMQIKQIKEPPKETKKDKWFWMVLSSAIALILLIIVFIAKWVKSNQ